MQNPPSVMANNKEAVEQLERDGGDGKEIHRCNGFAMIAQKRQPELGGFRAPGRSPHPTRDGSLGYVKAEHEEFPVDARAPQVGFSAAIWKISSRIFLEILRP